MVRTHKLDLLVLLIPVLRPLQILRLAPAASAVQRTFRSLLTVVGRPGIPQYFLATTAAIFIGAWFALIFERGQAGASIDDYGTALWWSFVTCTTVGYGDHFPVTGPGQVVADVLIFQLDPALKTARGEFACQPGGLPRGQEVAAFQTQRGPGPEIGMRRRAMCCRMSACRRASRWMARRRRRISS